jgi:fucose 4-O-acetylase-like acetyltransferase
MKDRDIQIDIIKGIAISLVVIGHIVPGITGQVIFLFHMPLFFMVSGYFQKIERQEIKFLKKRIISLLIPYVSYLFVFGVPSIIKELIKNPSEAAILSSLRYITKLTYGGQVLTGTFGIFWFVSCLFFTQQLFNFIGVRINNERKLLSISIVFYLISFLNQIYFKNLIFPLGVNVVLCSFLFYSVGSIYGNYIFKHQGRLAILLSAIISIFSLLLLVSGFNLGFNMKYTYYGYFIISPLAAISMSKILAYFANFIKENKLLSLTFSFLSQASITIMFCHQFFHFGVVELCNKWPWLMSFVILLVCCILHKLFLMRSFSRALLLGSRQDIALLTNPMPADR